MANKGTREPLGATDSGPRPGLLRAWLRVVQSGGQSHAGSAETEQEELRFRSIEDGSVVNFDGLAKQIRAARKALPRGPLVKRKAKDNGGRRVQRLNRLNQISRIQFSSFPDRHRKALSHFRVSKPCGNHPPTRILDARVLEEFAMIQLVVYAPDGNKHYDNVTSVSTGDGVLKFDWRRHRDDATYSTVKTNCPFFVEETFQH